jgi:hypothetical protein
MSDQPGSNPQIRLAAALLALLLGVAAAIIAFALLHTVLA